ncbi:thiamine phosphate synthase, partial [uncultured Clostridium sp.]|uniref:thiamine phosphate synthase n=1 Tax=uncultured Clostridium sp. TaxID=59620 RepID=UPI002630688F
MNKEIYVITNRNLVSSDEEYFKVIEGVVRAKVDYIILREKEFSDERLYLVAKKILLIIGNRKTKLIINSNIAVYSRLENVMLHLKFNDFLKYKKSLNEKVGVSIHSVEEVEIVEKLAPLYILASNIYETKCKIG